MESSVGFVSGELYIWVATLNPLGGFIFRGGAHFVYVQEHFAAFLMYAATFLISMCTFCVLFQRPTILKCCSQGFSKPFWGHSSPPPFWHLPSLVTPPIQSPGIRAKFRRIALSNTRSYFPPFLAPVSESAVPGYEDLPSPFAPLPIQSFSSIRFQIESNVRRWILDELWARGGCPTIFP